MKVEQLIPVVQGVIEELEKIEQAGDIEISVSDLLQIIADKISN